LAYTVELKGVDKTSIVKQGSLSVTLSADGRSSCSFSIITTSAYADIIGYNIKVKDNGTMIYGGIVNQTFITRIDAVVGATAILQIDISSNGFNDIPARRTTTAFYKNKYAGEIVQDIVTNVLNLSSADENLLIGTINNGAYFKQYSSNAKTCNDIFDELADASGFKWYINKSREVYFIDEDAIVASTHDIVEGGAFEDFNIDSVDVTLENYRNKQTVIGGLTSAGLLVQSVVTDSAEITARQTAENSAYSSGVYGNVLVDSNILTVTEATTVAQNELKKYGLIPAALQFSSWTNDWVVGSKLKVNLPTFGISTDQYYLIENIDIIDMGAGNIKSSISATRRNGSNFSTQRSQSYVDYFGKIIKTTKNPSTNIGGNIVYDEDGTAYSLKIYVQPDLPTSANEKDLWVDTDDWSRYDKLALSGATTLTVDSFEFVTCSGTFNLTLHVATSAGIIKKIYNIGTGIVTIIGTINGATNKLLYPNEAIELITDGTGWRY
jgi:hypothetical protein